MVFYKRKPISPNLRVLLQLGSKQMCAACSNPSTTLNKPHVFGTIFLTTTFQVKVLSNASLIQMCILKRVQV
jgi:hypothetical protein